jgi:hypothetical protein
MKKIINGAKYDTSTAERIGEWHTQGIGISDFNYCSEDLYRTKSGKYFLHGEGGALSKYNESCGNNNRCGSSEIMPMTREAAMEWAEEHLDGDEYEDIFGVVTEDSSVESLVVNIPSALKAKLKLKSETDGDSITAIVIKILSDNI